MGAGRLCGMKEYRVTTRNACFGIETDDNDIILNTSRTAPIAKKYSGKHMSVLKKFSAVFELFEDGKIV